MKHVRDHLVIIKAFSLCMMITLKAEKDTNWDALIGPYQTSVVENFPKIVNGSKPLTISTKVFITDI